MEDKKCPKCGKVRWHRMTDAEPARCMECGYVASIDEIEVTDDPTPTP